MKAVVFLVIFGIFAVDVKGQDPLQWAAITVSRGMCQLKTGATEDRIQRVRNYDFSSNDAAIKRYVYCVYRDLRLMDRNGALKTDYVLTVLPEDTDPTKFTNAVNACKSVTGADRNEKAYNFIKCYYKQYPNDVVIL